MNTAFILHVLQKESDFVLGNKQVGVGAGLQRQRFPEIDMDGFDIGVAKRRGVSPSQEGFIMGGDVLVQCVFALLASHTRLLVPSEWHVRIERVDAVNPNRAGF